MSELSVHKIHSLKFTVLALNTLLKELKNILVSRLPDLHSMIKSLGVDIDKSEKSPKGIFVLQVHSETYPKR